MEHPKFINLDHNKFRAPTVPKLAADCGEGRRVSVMMTSATKSSREPERFAGTYHLKYFYYNKI